MIRQSIAASDVQLWRPAEFKSVKNPDFDHIKHLQNQVYFLLTEGCMYLKKKIKRTTVSINQHHRKILFSLSFSYSFK